MSSENIKVVREQGGDKLRIDSGGELEIQAGGTLDIQDGVILGDVQKTDTQTVPLSAVQAGAVNIIPAVTGRTVTVTDFALRVSGAFTGDGSPVMKLRDTDGTIQVAAIAEAALSDQAILFPDTANVALSQGFIKDLTTSAGLELYGGSAAAWSAGGSIYWRLDYKVG